MQVVLDNITFCKFADDDVRNCPCKTVAQLVQIFQFTVEYFLHCQETQNVIISKLHKKKAILQASNNRFAQQNAALRENLKIYQKQLAIVGNKIPNWNSSAEVQPPKIVLSNQEQQKATNAMEMQPIIESILNHEKESRELMRSLLEDQRSTFMKELEFNFSANYTPGNDRSSSESKALEDVKGVKSTSSIVKVAEYNDHFDGGQVDNLTKHLTELIKQQKIESEKIMQLTVENATQSIRMVKSLAEIEDKKKELIQRERELKHKEDNLVADNLDFENRKIAFAEKNKSKAFLSSVDSLSSLREGEVSKDLVNNLKIRARTTAALAMKARILQGTMSVLSTMYSINHLFLLVFPFLSL